MHCKFLSQILAACLGVLLASVPAWAGVTNAPAPVTSAELAQNYLQIQEQIHASQMAIEKSQAAALAAARSNAAALTARLNSLQQTVATQQAAAAKSARQTQQLTLIFAGVFGLIGLGILLLMVYFQWRAFAQLARLASPQPAVIADVHAGVHQLAAPGRAAIETSNTRLLNVVDQLEKRIQELEADQRLLPKLNESNPDDLLAEARRQLDLSQPQAALQALDKFLARHPEHAEALTKRAMALEKLGRTDEALSGYDQAIAADGTLAIAHLQKGGLLNRLRRYDEALDCYENALLAQEKGTAARAV